MNQIKTPRFFIAGAPKSGTTWLAQVLGCHPDVFMPVVKEPAFFSRDPDHGHFKRGWPFYEKNFATAKDNQCVGEASTLYFHDRESASLIHKNISDAQIIIVLRNPVDRVYSNYWQYIKSGFSFPDLDTMISQKSEWLEHMLRVSNYPEHVGRFVNVFGFQSVLVLNYKDLRDRPAVVMDQILKFLGIERPLNSECLNQGPANLAGVPRSRCVARLLRQKGMIQEIKGILPASWIAPSRRFLDKLRWKNTRVKSYPPLSMDQRRYLWHRLEEVPEQVEELTGMSLEDWKKDRETALAGLGN
jgi:hypothetical protein